MADVRTAEWPDDPWDPPATVLWYADPDERTDPSSERRAGLPAELRQAVADPPLALR